MYNIDTIKEQFREVIRYTQGIPDPKIDYLFSRWEAAKKKFIERFGGLSRLSLLLTQSRRKSGHWILLSV